MTQTEIDLARDLGATSKLLPIASKVLGPAGYLGAVVNTVHDVMALQSGEMSVAKFSYKFTGTALGIAVTLYTANPILGALVGGSFQAGQIMYDGAIFAIDKASQFLGNCESALSYGKWVPGR